MAISLHGRTLLGRLRHHVGLVWFLLCGLGLTACSGGGGGGGDSNPTSPNQQPPAITLENEVNRVTFLAPPQGQGETQIVVQFLARDSRGQPLGPDEVDVTLTLDGKPLDPEAILSRQAEELSRDIRYAMVLDASYSMMLPDGKPFATMKAAAVSSATALEQAWADHAGTARWTFNWFNNRIFSLFGNEPDPEQLLYLPEPQAGEYTKLHAAVHDMALRLKNEFTTRQFGAGERDHHVLVIFTDGMDNYSHYDNSYLEPGSGLLGSGVHYRSTGYPSITLEDVLKVLHEHDRLTVHTIGLGPTINESDLIALANTEGQDSERPVGRFLKGELQDLDAMFQEITREFTTLQTYGAKVPLAPGRYQFGVKVVSRANPAESYTWVFPFRGGDENAGAELRRPRFLTTPPDTATAGQEYLYPFEVDADPEAQLTFKGPTWLTLDPVRKLLSGVPPTGEVGRPQSVELHAWNKEGTDKQAFSIDIHQLWSNMASGTWQNLNQIWGFPTDASLPARPVFAVGDDGTILVHASGAWQRVAPPPTPASLTGIWGKDESHIFAVGNGEILYFNGATWSRILTGYSHCFRAVWGTSYRNVFMVGDNGTILHFDGLTLRFQDSGTTRDLHGVWGAGPGVVFAVGEGGVILRYDGQSWRRQVSGTLADLYDIAGSSQTHIMAVGAAGTILHYDGLLWSQHYAPTTRDLFGVWVGNPTDMFAVGDWGTVLHHGGSSWKTMKSWTANNLFSVWGYQSDEVFVVGSGGLVLKYGLR